MNRSHWLLSRVFIVAVIAGPSLATAEFYVGIDVGVTDVSDFANGPQRSLYLPPPLPTSIPIDAARFEDSDAKIGGFAGYTVLNWLSIELGYEDLGTFGTAGSSLPSSGSSDLGAATLSVDQVRFGAKFSFSFSERWTANGYAGLSRVNFSASGGLGGFTYLGGGVGLRAEREAFPGVSPVLGLGEFVTTPGPDEPFGFGVQEFPFASPDDETGWTLGAGATFRVTERLSIDIGYRHHELRVMKADTVSIGVLFYVGATD